MLAADQCSNEGAILTDDPFENPGYGLDDPARRRRLLQLLTSGALLLAPASGANAFFWGSDKQKLADDKSIFTLDGEVRVNGERADESSRIRGGDVVSTGPASEIVFAVGGDAFILRAESELEIGGSEFLIDSLRMLTGRLLSVFARREPGQQLSVTASTATIGIRGTAAYLESEPDLAYLCTCYGQVEVAANEDPDDRQLITTTNHDDPRYISRLPNRGSRIRKAPVLRHTNTELRLLENLVGRDVPQRLRKAYVKY